MAAVERVAGSDPDPGDPFRGLYISDEVALRLSQGESGSDADERLTGVVAALGLDRLAAALLGGRMDESPQPTRLRMAELPVHTPGREASVATMTALLQRPSHL